MVNVFTVSAFFIVLREVLEACLTVGIVLAYLEKTGATHLRKNVWAGAGLGVVLSGIAGITFAVLYYSREKALFSGKGEVIFEGVAFLFAAALLTWMILWMLAMGKDMQRQLESKVERVIDSDTSKKAAWGIFAMMFVQVLREGVETFIFLFGATASENAGPNVGIDRSAWKGILVPGFLGLVIGLAVSYVVFRGLVTLDIQSFFLISSVVLMSFAAGLFSRGFHELQELDLFGAYDRRNGLKIESADRGWVNAEMWSTKECCDAEENEFFAMMRALFGYADKPTFLEFSTYFLYWAIILAVLIAINWTVVRAARNRTARYARGCAFFSLISFIVGFIYACLNASWTALLVTFFGLILSIGATLAVFDVLTDSVTALGGVRRMIALACAVGLALFTFFVCVLHLVQMSCLDKRCHLPPFFYWALIFQKGWVEGDNTGTSWHAVGSLAVSFVFSFFFLGGFALVMYLYSGHVGSDGSYIYEDRVKVGENAVADALDDSSPHRSSSDDAAGGRSPGGAPEVAVV